MKRPAIPWRVVLAAAIRQAGGSIPCAETGEPITEKEALNKKTGVQRDHNPPLALRPYDEESGTYEPDANNALFIDIVSYKGHNIRTHKRRGLARGDQTEIAHVKRVSKKHKAHLDRMSDKSKKKEDKKQGKKLRSRPFMTNRDSKWKKPMGGKPAEHRKKS